METIEYRTIEKGDWGPGPWQEEPDKVQFVDPSTGLPCIAKRHPTSGHWCGYVGVEEGHPMFGKDAFDEDAYDREGYYDLDVHGGVTFTSFCQEGSEADTVCHVPGPGEPDHVWWVGFDFHHAFDLAPGFHARMLRDLPDLYPFGGYPNAPEEIYWTLGMVKDECASAAAQLAAMK